MTTDNLLALTCTLCLFLHAGSILYGWDFIHPCIIALSSALIASPFTELNPKKDSTHD